MHMQVKADPLHGLAEQMWQIVSAVAYCHDRHIIHGDLKPENVLVSDFWPNETPFCIVCDFGHASLYIGWKNRIFESGDPRYIPPEVMLKEFMTPKSDIYMLGISAYELLSGGWLPFFGRKVSLTQSYYHLKHSSVQDEVCYGEIDFTRLKNSPMEARKMVKSMTRRSAETRPTAAEVLDSIWLQRNKPCGDGDEVSWGLWNVEHHKFKERLLCRANQSIPYLLLLSFICHALDTGTIFGCRLLFCCMNQSGTGVVTRQEFYHVAKRARLDAEISDKLFDSVDFNRRGVLDLSSIETLLLDLDSFSDEELLRELHSVLNHLKVPVFELPASDGDSGCNGWRLEGGARFDSLRDALRSHASTEEFSAEFLLRIVREGGI